MQSLLQGLPLETQAYTYSQPTGFEQLQGDFSDITTLLDSLFKTFGTGSTSPVSASSNPLSSTTIADETNQFATAGG